MEVATAKEARALTNKTKAITPGTLKEVLSSYATQEYAREHGGEGHSSSLINDVKVNGTSVVNNKVAYVSVPTALSELTNDTDFVQKVNNYIPSELIPEAIKNQITEVNGQLPAVGTIGRLYIKTDVNKIYRWNAIASEYVEVSEQLSLGESSSQAYWGDKGKIAYDHSQIVNGNPHGLTLGTFGITVAANKINYLTDVTSNIGAALNSKLNLSGGAMTGMLTLSANPTENMHAVTKYYADEKYNDTLVLITLNINNIKSISKYFDKYIEESKTTVDTVATLSNSMDGYDTYIQCPNYKYLDEVDYYIKTTQTVYEKTDDILFREFVVYYTRSGSGTTQDPYVYTVYTGDPAYHVDDIIPSTLELYIKYDNKEEYNLMTPGTDYTIGDVVYDLTSDLTYQEDKTYYIADDDELSWIMLEVIGYKKQTGEFDEDKTYYEKINNSYIEVSYDSSTQTYTLYNGDVYMVGDQIPTSVNVYLYTGDYNIGDNIPADTVYEFNNIYTLQRTSGLNQAVQRSEEFINTQTETNSKLEKSFTSVDILTKSLNTSVNGGEIYIVSNDYIFEADKTYYYKNNEDLYKVYTGYTVGDLIVTSSEYTCTGEESGTYHFIFNDTAYSFTMPNSIEQGSKLVYDADQEKLFFNETEITLTESETGTKLEFNNIKPIEVYETQMQLALSEVINNKYSDVVDKLADYATTESVTAEIKTLKETTTSSYKKTEIQSILRGIGFVLTEDKTYQDNKTYYDENHEKLTNYNIGDTIPVGSSGLNETVYERLEVSSFKSKAGTFSDAGLTIEEYDDKQRLIGDSTSTLDSSGLKVNAVVGGVKSLDPILYAGADPKNKGKSIVTSANINVKDFLYAANEHLRFEEYTSDDVDAEVGWGGFYL